MVLAALVVQTHLMADRAATTCSAEWLRLNANQLLSIADARSKIEPWRTDYSEERPHDSLGRVPPLTFMPRRAARESTLSLTAKPKKRCGAMSKTKVWQVQGAPL
jgi:Integrase core domain